MNRNMNKSKTSVEHNPPQPIQTINADLVAYRDGQGPPGQVFMIPRAVLIEDFYQDAEIPAWTAVAEQVLRAEMVVRGIDPWYLPPPRRILRKEAKVADFFWNLSFWMEDDPERRSAHRVLYEAIRRLPDQAWFEETKGNAAYLQLWCNGIVQAVPAAM